MDRKNDDKDVLIKVNRIVKEDLPDFASRYFRHNIDTLAPRSLYGYAMDLKLFFKYLDSISFKTGKIVLADLDKITPEIIENYLDHSLTYTDEKGHIKERSTCGLKRLYSSLSSFFSYFYKYDMIDHNPVSKVQCPQVKKHTGSLASVSVSQKILEYAINGTLDGKRANYQFYTRRRDIAIIMLITESGLKASDCVELDIADVHLAERYITVRRRKFERKIYISDAVSKALSNYLEERLELIPVYGHDCALFLSLQNKRICARSIQKMLKNYSEALFGKENNVTSLAMNMSFRNNLLGQTMNMELISNICGTDINTLYQYYQPLIEEYMCEKFK